MIGNGLRVHFKALQSALIDQPKAPKHQSTKENSSLESTIVLRVIEIMREKPDISQDALGQELGITRRVVQKYVNKLKKDGRIERVGGKRYGHWEIQD